LFKNLISHPQLEGDGLTLTFLFTTELKRLTALNYNLRLVLALNAFKTKTDLTGGLRLFVKYRARLSTESLLLAVVPALSLCKERSLARFVLRDLMESVLVALGRRAKGLAGLRDVDHLVKNLERSPDSWVKFPVSSHISSNISY